MAHPEFLVICTCMCGHREEGQAEQIEDSDPLLYSAVHQVL